MATSSSSCARLQGKYDVFVSFRGEDTRNNITSHLDDALRRAKILTFLDNNLQRGYEISPSLLKAIEESKLSVIIFSKNYASSKWCLDELAKIHECKKMIGQIVIPVFYQVDPSHVRNQTGSFDFAEHEQLLKENEDKVNSWRAALKEVANLSGWDSKVTRPESELIKKIVGDILKKLSRMSRNHSIGLVGIDARIVQVKSLMQVELQDVRIIGIWGMGGIGKTTIARAALDRFCTQFEGSYFLEVKDESLVCLQNKLFSKILDEETPDIDTLSVGGAFIMNRLQQKKVLIVLDDADDSTKLKELLGNQCSLFGPGSRILITSRDRQVLNNVVDAMYEVERLNNHESLQLFSLNAFKTDHPTNDQVKRSKGMLNYGKGNPLALKVLGSALFGRSQEDWDSASARLEKVPDSEIQKVLRISYDKLDPEQQKIFLDIACFFIGEAWDHVTKILDGCYSSVHFTLSVLIDKSLIAIPENKIEMHDLLQEMGRGIVHEESITRPEKRSRLWNAEDIYHVLTKKRKKGAEAIEGIFLDMSKAREMQLESDAFEGMDCLRLLKFCATDFSGSWMDKVRLPHGLQFLSDELRSLHWHGFPSKSLPSNFCAENLVELNLSHSKVQQLWTGVQDLVNLKKFNVMYSEHLSGIPDLSKAEKVESINLEGCESMVEVPLSIQCLNNLEYLNLKGCKNLRSLPSRIDSKVLTGLYLSECFNLNNCPEISGNLEVLDLSWTAIEELPQSIHELESLRVLDLYGCSNITKLPEIPRSMQVLDLSGTAIEGLPSSIESLTKLVHFRLWNCKKLQRLPSKICELRCLDLAGCSDLENLPSSIGHLNCRQNLDCSFKENDKKMYPSYSASVKRSGFRPGNQRGICVQLLKPYGLKYRPISRQTRLSQPR